MDYDKLIERLRKEAYGSDIEELLLEAATALSTLQAENARLREELEYEREHANAYYEECGQWEAENTQLKEKLEALKQDRDAIEQDFRAFAKQWWEEDSGFPCRWCKFERQGGCEWKVKHPGEICAGRAFEWRGQRGDCPGCGEPLSQAPNEPLTLEELRKMDGQPVWVKVIGKTGIRCDGWCEVEIREKDPFAYVWWPGSEVEDIAKIEDYGKTWACYAYPPAHIDREVWVSVEDRMPKYNIREDGELVSSKILVRCEIDKTVHLVVSKKFYTGRPGEMVHSVFRFYDEWGDIIENVSHWMPLPEPPAELEKRMGVR